MDVFFPNDLILSEILPVGGAELDAPMMVDPVAQVPIRIVDLAIGGVVDPIASGGFILNLEIFGLSGRGTTPQQMHPGTIWLVEGIWPCESSFERAQDGYLLPVLMITFTPEIPPEVPGPIAMLVKIGPE
jgi:hypothetical protein